MNVTEMKKWTDFLKRHYGNIIFFILLLLLIIPGTRMPIQVFIQRVLAGAPRELARDKRPELRDFDWKLQTGYNEIVDFSRSKGKVVVLNFWATWCPPCVAEMPSFQKLYDAYGEKVDFYFVGSEPMEQIGRFLKKKNYTLPVYLERSQTPEPVQTTAIPATFIISKKGVITMHVTGASDWNGTRVHTLLEELLKE